MPDPRDRVDIDGIPSPGGRGNDAPGTGNPDQRFLMIWFRCCHAYGRLTRNREATRYEGRCPRCSAPLSVRVGPGGTERRIFEAR
ncbi:MAG: hypothetical protein CMJ51_03660 [Planctomycetaceae bacterium]|nr:hypothetical protein [Planctomycetaceae bacterium]